MSEENKVYLDVEEMSIMAPMGHKHVRNACACALSDSIVRVYLRQW